MLSYVWPIALVIISNVVYQICVGGKVNLPPHGKEFFHAAVSSFLHPR